MSGGPEFHNALRKYGPVPYRAWLSGALSRTAPSGAVFEHRHVMDLDQAAGLVDDCDGALNADINPEMQSHCAVPAIASKAAPSAVAGPPS